VPLNSLNQLAAAAAALNHLASLQRQGLQLASLSLNRAQEISLELKPGHFRSKLLLMWCLVLTYFAYFADLQT
jgi:hypothetical protein